MCDRQRHDCFIRILSIILIVLLECIGILCQFSKPDWFLETFETSLELPLPMCSCNLILEN